MRDAGLVNGRREGRCVYYRVDPRGMKPLIDWMAHYRAFWTEHVGRLEELLDDGREARGRAREDLMNNSNRRNGSDRKKGKP